MEDKRLEHSAYLVEKALNHGIFDIWNEDNVVRNKLGQFAKKVGDTANAAGKAVGDVANATGKAIGDTANAAGKAVGEAATAVKDTTEMIFALAGGLPDWVYAQLFYAVNNGLLSEAELRTAFNSLGKNPSMQQKINVVDQLINRRKQEIDTDGFNSLDELPKKPIKPLEEVLKEDHFEYVDWEDEDKRVGNCPLSTFSYELQRRGYDVEAMDWENGTDMQITSLQIADEWINSDGTLKATKKEMDDIDASFSQEFTTYDMYSSKPSDAKYFKNSYDMTSYIKKNPKEFPPKSRGFLEMDGHIQNWEVNAQGKVIWIDGQIGGIFGEGELGRTTPTDQVRASSMVAVLRTDNKEINEEYLVAVREQDDTVRALEYMKNQLEREKYEVSDNVRGDVSDYYVDLFEEEINKIK